MTEIERLKDIVRKLRADDGCPWDRVQTHESLKAACVEEEGYFTFDDVVKTVSDKMVRRHPHVFSGRVFESDGDRHAAWEEIKKQEKEGKEWQTPYLENAMNEAAELIDTARIRKGFIDRKEDTEDGQKS